MAPLDAASDLAVRPDPDIREPVRRAPASTMRPADLPPLAANENRPRRRSASPLVGALAASLAVWGVMLLVIAVI